MSDRVTVCKPTEELDRLRMWTDDAAAELTRLRADLAAAQEERDNAIVQRAAERLATLTAEKALASAQEREQRMREALQKIASYSEAMSADYIGYGGESGHAHTARLARAALGEPQ